MGRRGIDRAKIFPGRVDEKQARAKAERYMRARWVLRDLKGAYQRKEITPQQYRTIRGQAVAGDVDGAVKGLAQIVRGMYEG